MKKQSEINGTGYGDSHSWIRGETNQYAMGYSDKFTEYSCDCGAFFRHFYDVQPGIFEAIKESGVIDKCPLLK